MATAVVVMRCLNSDQHIKDARNSDIECESAINVSFLSLRSELFILLIPIVLYTA